MTANVIRPLEGRHTFHKPDHLQMKFRGSLDEAVAFAVRNQICEVGLWQKFVDLFRRGQDVCDGDGVVASEKVFCPEIKEAPFCFEVPLASGGTVRLVEYAAAGKTWDDESRCAAWIRRI